MSKIAFSWFLKQAKDSKTKLQLKKYQKIEKELFAKKVPILFEEKQKFPLRFKTFRVWLNDENVFGSLDVLQGIFKEREHTKLKSFLGEKDKIIVDLGANEGFYTLKLKQNSPKARIISVEPNPVAFKLLKKNVKENKLRNVTCLNAAVSSKNGKINFEIAKGKTTVGGTRVFKKYRRKYKVRKILVNSITLKKLCQMYNLQKIDLLKIDTEGGEVGVLKGGGKIWSKIKQVVIEYHKFQKTKPKVMKFMLSHSFKILLIDKEKFYGDIYFGKNE